MPPLAELPAAYQALVDENAVLRAQIEWFRRKLFGGGQGERLDRAQLLLKLEELEKLVQAAKPVETISYERQKPATTKRTVPAATFAHLPVQETVVIEPDAVQAEPAAYERIGEERTFEIDVVPPRLFKREFIRPKYRRKDDATQPPVVAPAPVRPVPGGYVSAGLLAWIAVSKYVDHLPLFRLEQMSQRWGATLSRQSMVEWIRIVADITEPIYKRMHAELLAGGYVQADETPVNYHDPGQNRGQTQQGFLWAVSRPGGDVVFDWRLSRRHGEVTTLLGESYRGVLQSDAYEAYASYARAHPDVDWVGCWAHARRMFHDALGEAPQRAGFVLRLIARFYLYEREWNEAGLTGPGLRAALRTGQWALTLRLLHKTALRLRELVLPKSLFGQACTYLLNQWEPLTAHVRCGRTQIDNNAIENAIRPSKLGAKNWLFIGHPDAGRRSAIIYSLVVSCRRHGKDPLLYLRDVLTRLPAMTNQDDLAPLLPANWLPTPSSTPASPSAH